MAPRNPRRSSQQKGSTVPYLTKKNAVTAVIIVFGFLFAVRLAAAPAATLAQPLNTQPVGMPPGAPEGVVPASYRTVETDDKEKIVYKIPHKHTEDVLGCGGLRDGVNNAPNLEPWLGTDPDNPNCKLRPAKRKPLPNLFLDKSVDRQRHIDAGAAFVHLAKSGGSTFKTLMVKAGKANGFQTRTVSFGMRTKIEVAATAGDVAELNRLWPEGTWVAGGGVPNLHTIYDREMSYIIMLREPVSRAISGYNYYSNVHDGHCFLGGTGTTIVEYACWAANHTYNTMTTLPVYGDMPSRGHDPTPPPFANVCKAKEFGHGEYQRYRCGTPSKEEYERVLYELENEYALILLLEDFDVGEQMFYHAYGLEGGKAKVVNSARTSRQSCFPAEEELDEMAKCLRYDIMLYEKAREIYNRQKEVYLREIGEVV